MQWQEDVKHAELKSDKASLVWWFSLGLLVWTVVCCSMGFLCGRWFARSRVHHHVGKTVKAPLQTKSVRLGEAQTGPLPLPELITITKFGACYHSWRCESVKDKVGTRDLRPCSHCRGFLERRLKGQPWDKDE